MMDFLALLENDSADAAADEDGHAHLALAPVESAERNDLPQQSDALVPVQRGGFQRRSIFPSLAGRVGRGRHGGFAERALLTCHMRIFDLQLLASFGNRVFSPVFLVLELIFLNPFFHIPRFCKAGKTSGKLFPDSIRASAG